MSRGRPSVRPREPQPRRPLPPAVASLLVQSGAFAVVLGVGVLILSAAYGGGAFGLGIALVAGGYAAVGFPEWYHARLPAYRSGLHQLTAWRR